MYIPEYYKLEDKDTINDFIEKYSFATLFSQYNGEPWATHLPIVFNKDENVLYGHIAHGNRQWEDAINQQVLTVFQGPHCYISPSSYDTHQKVPTWNYVSIHVYGKMEIFNDKDMVLRYLNDLVNKYEESDSPYNYRDVNPAYIEGMLDELVAFKIHITKIEAQAKLSQDHPIERQELVSKHLESHPDENAREVAALMRKNLNNK